MPGFLSLSYAAPEQNIPPNIKGATERLKSEVSHFPIIIRLFEAGPKGSFAERLRATGVEFGHYDAGLHRYESAGDAGTGARGFSDHDFVLVSEIDKRGRSEARISSG